MKQNFSRKIHLCLTISILQNYSFQCFELIIIIIIFLKVIIFVVIIIIIPMIHRYKIKENCFELIMDSIKNINHSSYMYNFQKLV